MRNRNIISEIIETANKLSNDIGKSSIFQRLTKMFFSLLDNKFQKFRDDDEDNGMV